MHITRPSALAWRSRILKKRDVTLYTRLRVFSPIGRASKPKRPSSGDQNVHPRLDAESDAILRIPHYRRATQSSSPSAAEFPSRHVALSQSSKRMGQYRNYQSLVGDRVSRDSILRMPQHKMIPQQVPYVANRVLPKECFYMGKELDRGPRCL
ncbi:hypothetical protein VTK56DRAFT_4329 [Thermocarpiscus australiensis]